MKVITDFFNTTSQFPQTWTANGWSDWEVQRRMFRTLSQIFVGGPGSILDVGCGTGEFYKFIHQNVDEGSISLWKYTGIDLSHPMIERARKEHELIDATVCDLMNFKSPHDYVVGAGPFNLRIGGDQAIYIRSHIGKMYSLANRAVALTLLSSTLKSKDLDEESLRQLYFYSPGVILRTCLEFTPKVKLDHASLADQFVVFMYK